MLAHFETNVNFNVDLNRFRRRKSLHAWVMLGMVTQLCGSLGRREGDLVLQKAGMAGAGAQWWASPIGWYKSVNFRAEKGPVPPHWRGPRAMRTLSLIRPNQVGETGVSSALK